MTNNLTPQDFTKIYNNSNEEGKKLLEEKFGKEVFNNSLSTFEECCAFNGTKPEDIIPFKDPKNDDQRSVNAYAMLIEITRAHLRGKKKDWKNSSQRKYTNWYWMDKRSGSGLSLDDVVNGSSYTNVSSRLHSLDEAASKEIFEKFPQVVEDFMTEKD